MFFILGCAPELALLLASVMGVLFNFFSTGRLVFGSGDRRLLFRFCAVYAAIYLLNAAALRALIEFGISPLLAQALSLPFVAIIAFGLMRTLVFRREGCR